MSAAVQPLIYHVPDVARLLGCKPSSARRLMEQGHIPSRRLGRKLIVLPAELEAHLKALPKGSEPVAVEADQPATVEAA